MNPQEVLEKYRHIVVVNGRQVALEISHHLNQLNREQQRAYFGGEYKYGFFYLFNHPVHHDKMLETVVSPHGDGITSVYLVDPIFASIGELMRARAELCEAIASRIGLSLGAVGVEDWEGRGRMLGLEELGTGQLVDLLAGQMGSAIVTTSSIGGNADALSNLMK